MWTDLVRGGKPTEVPVAISNRVGLLPKGSELTSKGAAGNVGAGCVALAATLPTLGILPVAGLVLLLGVERFMSEIHAVTNMFSRIFATVVTSKWMGELDDERLRRELDESGADDERLDHAGMAREVRV